MFGGTYFKHYSTSTSTGRSVSHISGHPVYTGRGMQRMRRTDDELTSIVTIVLDSTRVSVYNGFTVYWRSYNIGDSCVGYRSFCPFTRDRSSGSLSAPTRGMCTRVTWSLISECRLLGIACVRTIHCLEWHVWETSVEWRFTKVKSLTHSLRTLYDVRIDTACNLLGPRLGIGPSQTFGWVGQNAVAWSGHPSITDIYSVHNYNCLALVAILVVRLSFL